MTRNIAGEKMALPNLKITIQIVMFQFQRHQQGDTVHCYTCNNVHLSLNRLLMQLL